MISQIEMFIPLLFWMVKCLGNLAEERSGKVQDGRPPIVLKMTTIVKYKACLLDNKMKKNILRPKKMRD